MRKKFIAGNWKMYKNIAAAKEFAEEFKKLYKPTDSARVAICAPFTQLATLKEAFAGTGIGVAAQNVHFADEGAYTGEVSVSMLTEIGVEYCVVGHSERRQYFAETDETVNLKLKKLLETNIDPILCIGESLDEREAGIQHRVVRDQLVDDLDGIDTESVKRITIAYEPIWAIGTGKTATAEQAQEMCESIRSLISDLYDPFTAQQIIIQYGGSVKPENAKELLNMPDIDGALVGGVSLKAESFIKVVDFNGSMC